MLMRTLRAGVFAGVLAGVLTAFLQLLLAVPIIAKAELFETGTLVFSASGKPFVLLSDIVPEMRSIQSMTTTAITTIISTVALG
ncbi:MAG: CbtA family protein, partial [Alphaproteobacteria bacterium]